jgi:hypothetical protein
VEEEEVPVGGGADVDFDPPEARARRGADGSEGVLGRPCAGMEAAMADHVHGSDLQLGPLTAI